MAGPRKGFQACVATKLNPKDFEECVRDFDNEKYKGIELIPHDALKLSVYDKTKNPALAAITTRSGISSLPRGLKNWIKQHPADYSDYLEERQSELEFLRALRRSSWREIQKELEARRRGEPVGNAAELSVPLAKQKKRRGQVNMVEGEGEDSDSE